MALLHATQLASAAVTNTVAPGTLLYTVPAGDRIILRSVAVRNLWGGGGNRVFIYVNGIVLWDPLLNAGQTAGDSQEWRPWIVATPGQTIRAQVSNANGVNVLVSGSIYTI
jgi:hypothetical protein